MKTNKILMAGALALSMVLSGGMLTGCSNSSNTKDTKTEDEKKEEQEVKQEEKKEEKKEETAKADSSNKSNISESKKDNTASTSSNSNKNNTSSSSKPSNSSSNNSGTSKPSNNSGSNASSSKPAEHTHNWVAVTETRTVVDQAAYDEQVPITEMVAWEKCDNCGADITADPSGHNKAEMLAGTGKYGWHTEWKEVVTWVSDSTS